MEEFFLLVLAGQFLAGCAFSPSQLNADRTRYNGLIVVVRGFVKLTPETHVLYESRALGDEVQRGVASGSRDFGLKKYEKYCLTIANPELLYKNSSSVNTKTITFQGKFINNYQIGQTVDRGACSLPTAIVIDNIALARRYPSLLPQK